MSECCCNCKKEPKKSLADCLRDIPLGDQRASWSFVDMEKAAREYIYQENMEKLEAKLKFAGYEKQWSFSFSFDELREVLK